MNEGLTFNCIIIFEDKLALHMNSTHRNLTSWTLSGNVCPLKLDSFFNMNLFIIWRPFRLKIWIQYYIYQTNSQTHLTCDVISFVSTFLLLMISLFSYHVTIFLDRIPEIFHSKHFAFFCILPDFRQTEIILFCIESDSTH